MRPLLEKVHTQVHPNVFFLFLALWSNEITADYSNWTNYCLCINCCI